MKTVAKRNNNGFKAEVKRFVNEKNKVCYIVCSNGKLVYSNIFYKRMTAISACNEFLQKKANPLSVA